MTTNADNASRSWLIALLLAGFSMAACHSRSDRDVAPSPPQAPAIALAQPSVPRNAMTEPSMPPGDYPSSPLGDYERPRQLQERRAQIIKVIRKK
jgi:hypothetical protein